MSNEEDNKAIVGRWFKEFWGENGNPDIVDELARKLRVRPIAASTAAGADTESVTSSSTPSARPPLLERNRRRANSP